MNQGFGQLRPVDAVSVLHPHVVADHPGQRLWMPVAHQNGAKNGKGTFEPYGPDTGRSDRGKSSFFEFQGTPPK